MELDASTGSVSTQWNHQERFLAAKGSHLTTEYRNFFWNQSAREFVADVVTELGTARGYCCCSASSDAAEVARIADGDVATPGSDYTLAWLG